jgi:DNA-binding winged helix-turn-helix (wHTH) protein
LLFSFENYTLDTERRELRRAAERIAVEPQVFDILEYLVRNRDRVVSRDDLIGSIWGGRIVSESALHTRINAVRSAVADDGKQQRLIRTLPRKGFRFVGAIQEDDKPTAIAPNVSSIGGERRQLTVLSCDLFPIDLSSSVELEDLRDIIETHLRQVAETVARFDGHVANRIGNLVLVNFGSPVAHEDDAEQAVRAGLDLCGVAAAAGSNSQSVWRPRIGIATGEVIITNSATGETTSREVLVGDAPTQSECLWASAPPGTVVIDGTTKSLIGDLFECRELDPIRAGALQTMQAWSVHASRVVEPICGAPFW